MKSIRRVLVYSLFLIAGACNSDKMVFRPTDPRPIQSIEVADMDEVELLQQEVEIEISHLQNSRLYYYGKGEDEAKKLTALGYSIREENPMEISYKLVQVSTDNRAPDKAAEEELIKNGIQIINKEESYFVVRGTLKQLNDIQALGYMLTALEKEISPRVVIILVPAYDDIQKVYDLGVDIYSTELDKLKVITIYGGAFDYQIEKMRQMAYQVTLK